MSREQIVRDTAYAIWEAEGKPEGRDAEHWRLAEERVSASLTGQGTTTKAAAKPKAKDSAAKDASAKAKEAAATPAVADKTVKKTATKTAGAKPAKAPAKGKV